jgi:hypothetical protein
MKFPLVSREWRISGLKFTLTERNRNTIPDAGKRQKKKRSCYGWRRHLLLSLSWQHHSTHAPSWFIR